VKNAGLRKQEETPSAGTKDPYKLTADRDSKWRITRPPSLGKQQRGEVARELALSPTTKSARVLATERLRSQAEKAENHNVVMELSLDGDYILWINYAWENVVGCASFPLYGASALLF